MISIQYDKDYDAGKFKMWEHSKRTINQFRVWNPRYVVTQTSFERRVTVVILIKVGE